MYIECERYMCSPTRYLAQLQKPLRSAVEKSMAQEQTSNIYSAGEEIPPCSCLGECSSGRDTSTPLWHTDITRVRPSSRDHKVTRSRSILYKRRWRQAVSGPAEIGLSVVVRKRRPGCILGVPWALCWIRRREAVTKDSEQNGESASFNVKQSAVAQVNRSRLIIYHHLVLWTS